MKKFLIVALACSFPSALLHADTANLLTNPGAETGTLSGWTPSSATNPTVDSGMFDPGINPHSGSFDFVGGPANAFATLSQTFSAITQGVTASSINSGNELADLSFWEQGLDQGPLSDEAGVTLTFLSSTSKVLGTDFSGYVDSHNGAWTNFSQDYLLPGGTTSIKYTIDFLRNVGSDNDPFVDDNSLVLSTKSAPPPPPPSPPSPIPEPSTFALLGTGLVGIIGAARRKLAV